jgi:hypothetical protein
MPIQEIHLLHHSHVDVGYTDLAPVIARRHVEYLDQVLDHCRRTDDYPDDARYRWVNEFSWPVVEFLRQRPQRAEELFRRHREGRLELAALFLNQITFGQWLDQLRLTRGCLYSWLLNNFWYTNFPGYQLGELRFRFALTSGAGELDTAAATAFGRQVRTGLTVI